MIDPWGHENARVVREAADLGFPLTERQRECLAHVESGHETESESQRLWWLSLDAALFTSAARRARAAQPTRKRLTVLDGGLA